MFPIIIYCKPGLIKEWKISEYKIGYRFLDNNPLSNTESLV